MGPLVHKLLNISNWGQKSVKASTGRVARHTALKPARPQRVRASEAGPRGWASLEKAQWWSSRFAPMYSYNTIMLLDPSAIPGTGLARCGHAIITCGMREKVEISPGTARGAPSIYCDSGPAVSLPSSLLLLLTLCLPFSLYICI